VPLIATLVFRLDGASYACDRRTTLIPTSSTILVFAATVVTSASMFDRSLSSFRRLFRLFGSQTCLKLACSHSSISFDSFVQPDQRIYNEDSRDNRDVINFRYFRAM